MDVLTINKLTLKNFKGIKDFTIEPCGKDISVLGDNAAGKTTLIDASSWLFFGKDSQGKADFQLKPVDQGGQEIHNLDTEVEGIYEFNNKAITLKKRFQEEYTKKRGEAKQTFTGHTTDYFIDDVPAKKKEFDSKIADILDVNAFKLVTNPMEFNLLHWTGRRQILLEMCGDVTDQDVIDSDKKLKSLSAILGDCSISDHKKKVKAKQTDINKELEKIPVRIAENQESAKNAVQPDPKNKKRIDKELEDARKKLRSLQSNEALSQKQIRLNEVNGEIQKAKNKADQEQTESRRPLLAVIEKLEAERRGMVNKIIILGDDIKRDEGRNNVSSAAIDKVREQWHQENDKHPGNDNTCPTCGQDLPEDQMQSTIESFNKLKADRLEKINKEGKELKANIDQREKDIKAANDKIDTHQKIVDGIDKTLEIKKSDLEKIYVQVDVEVLDKEKDVLETEIAALKNGSSVQEETAKRHIQEIEDKSAIWNTSEAEYKAAEKSRARVSELEAQEETLAAEFEKLESELFLIEKFIVKKVGMLEWQINGKFKMAKFKMFNVQINGGIEECCDTLYDGVPFNSTLNTGAKLNVGLDIINTLSEYYGFKAPVFLDNAESVTEIIDIDTQVIKLVVDKKYKELIHKVL